MDIETASMTRLPDGIESRRLFDDLMKSFEEFKNANDERLGEIEQRQSADTLLEEKVDRINTHLSQLSTTLQRPMLADNASNDGSADVETRAAFCDYVRSGDIGGLQTLEPKAFSYNDSDGGYTVPSVVYTDFEKRIGAISVFRQLARTHIASAGDKFNYVRPTDNFQARWIGEISSRRSTTTPDFVETSIPINEIYAQAQASPQFLEDSASDIENWILDSISFAFAQTEGRGFLNGDNTTTSSPDGLLEQTISYTYNAAGTTMFAQKTGATSALPRTNIPEFLMTFAYGLGGTYRGNASWMMNASILAEMRKVKDSEGRYLWSPGFSEGMSPSILGYPVYEEPFMSNLVSGGKIITFGDYKQAYLIVMRNQLRFVRDPYSGKPYVIFYITRRVGGAPIDPHACRVVIASA